LQNQALTTSVDRMKAEKAKVRYSVGGDFFCLADTQQFFVA
jgi:hypothetical protein